MYLQEQFQTSSLTARNIPRLRPISSRAIHNRLSDRHIRPRRPTICPILLPRHHAARLTWWNPFSLAQQWWPIPSLPLCRRTLCRRLRYSTSIVGGGSVMVLGRHNRTWQDTISCCRWKSDQNTLYYSVHTSSDQQRHIPAGQCYIMCCTWLPDTAECWCVTLASGFTHWARLGWNVMTVKSSAKVCQ